MADVESLIVDELQQPKGFDPYFADITYARDLIDPPIRRQKREVNRLSLTLDTDEYDAVGGIDIDAGRLTLAFGYGGLSEIAECITEVFEPENTNQETELAYNGIRFAVLFQSSQIFTNNRLKIDESFFTRFKAALPQNRTADVIYERQSILYPDLEPKINSDSALRYRVCQFASRIALDRISTAPYGHRLRTEPSNGKSIILTAMQAKLESELKTMRMDLPSIAEQTGFSNGLAFTALHQVYVGDTYPLMWQALAQPAKEGVVGEIAMAHIGHREHTRPGWMGISNAIDSI